MKLLSLTLAALLTSSAFCEEPITIKVDPHTTRSIGGHSELDRKRYFAICDQGTNFEARLASDDRYNHLINHLKISFGRSLGLVNWISKSRRYVREDANRPGHVDLEHLIKALKSQRKSPHLKLRKDRSPNLDIALHGQPNAYPDFIGAFTTPYLKENPSTGKHGPKLIPANHNAAAEFAATVLKYGFDDFTRPRFFEPINEPHWSYLIEPKELSDWHIATRQAVKKLTPDVLVGGPCNSVGYFYSNNYQAFNGVRSFIDATKDNLDFYSFHVYDYHRWNNDHFTGAILSGLPLEGVLDLIPNYTSLQLGREMPLVISEHGGYATGPDGENSHELSTLIAKQLNPGEGFEWELNARSIHDFIHTDSIIGNTLAFMDHPHTVLKAVPFMLLETSGWDPRYYASLYARKNFDRTSPEWVPTSLLHFYELFRDLQGRRVIATCPDPDLQVRAFVDGNTLLLVVHNLADKPESLNINAPTPTSTLVRRYGRDKKNLTPFLREQAASLNNINLGPRQTLLIRAEYAEAITEKRTLEESIHYGNAVTVKITGPTKLTIPVPNPSAIESATLRIGLTRPHDAGKAIKVSLNGQALTVPAEDSATRYTHEKHGYATTKLIPLDPKLLKDSNTVEISFPDGKPATIGSAVIRASRPK